MRNTTSATANALAARTLVARDFIWFSVRDRSTSAAVTDGLWSDVGNISAPMLNPDTGLSDTRTFYGAGGLVSVSDIPAVSNLTVQTITIVLSQIDDHVAGLFRTYDAKQARVEIYRGLLDPTTRGIVDPAICRFVGFIDEIQVKTPSENEEGSVTLTCNSYTEEANRYNPDTRSDASQKQRGSSDEFFRDASTVGDWEHFWGTTKGKVEASGSQAKQGLFGLGNLFGFL